MITTKNIYFQHVFKRYNFDIAEIQMAKFHRTVKINNKINICYSPGCPIDVLNQASYLLVNTHVKKT